MKQFFVFKHSRNRIFWIIHAISSGSEVKAFFFYPEQNYTTSDFGCLTEVFENILTVHAIMENHELLNLWNERRTQTLFFSAEKEFAKKQKNSSNEINFNGLKELKNIEKLFFPSKAFQMNLIALIICWMFHVCFLFLISLIIWIKNVSLDKLL